MRYETRIIMAILTPIMGLWQPHGFEDFDHSISPGVKRSIFEAWTVKNMDRIE